MAQARQRNHQYSRGSQMAEVLQPAAGYRGELVKKGIRPRDHLHANRAALREVSARNREKLLEKQAAKEVQPWKLREFRSVESRYRTAQGSAPAAARGEEKTARDRNFLRRGAGQQRLETRVDTLRTPREEPNGPNPSARKPRVPAKTEVMQLAPRTPRDFVLKNKAEALDSRPSHSDEAPAEGRHEDFGTVPAYLLERKRQWAEAEAERRARLPDPSCPPGMRLLPDAERLETLANLEESEQQLRQILFQIPLSATTVSLVRRREMLDEKLKKVEDARIIFSRQRVYVQDE